MAARTPIVPAGEEALAADARARPRSLGFPLDPLLLLAVLGLAACSLVTIWGATKGEAPGSPYHYVERQAIYFAVGIAGMLALSRLDYTRLRVLRRAIYGLLIGTILLVLAIGGVSHGSRRWIDFPGFTFQPSELGKLLLVLALAAFLVDRSRRLSDRRTTTRIMLMALVPAALVMVQPDLGSGIVYVVIALGVLFVAGTSWRHFAALAAVLAVALALVLAAAPAAGVHVLKPYQVDRLTAFLHPSDNPRDEGYQQNQSRIAIGSGEKTGRGVQHATQTRLDFLPEHHTDFIFAVVGETYGFVGAALVLALYALAIWRGLRILTLAKDLFGALVAGGIVTMLLWQVFVNIGMTVGIMPITGVPLPLLSYGGSSVIVTLLALGVLQSIYAQGRAVALSKARGPLP